MTTLQNPDTTHPPGAAAPRPPLAGKTALITGAARRVGAEIARALHRCGANVVIHCNRSRSEADALAAELDAQRAGSAHVLQADLLAAATPTLLVEATLQRFGQLDILVNNASTFYPTPFGEITAAHWDDLMGSNLKAPLFMAQAALTPLRLARGLVINIVDIHGMRPLRRYPVYSAAKAGLIMLTKSLAREMGPQVRVNGIAPGPVMWPEDGTADSDLQRKIVDRTALKRSGSAADIARAAVFFATEAPFVTGQILAVDGGRSVGW
jgi:pteridine reductase